MPGWEEGNWRDETLCQFKESNLLNSMGLEFYDLSHPRGALANLAGLISRM